MSLLSGTLLPILRNNFDSAFKLLPLRRIMFKSFIAISLLFALMFANFSKLFIYAGFDLNQKYIATTLCINRNKPEMHCNGKCYLARKLKQAEEKEQKQERQSQKTQVLDVLVIKRLVFKQYPSFTALHFHIPSSTGIPRTIKNSIFHPPQAA